jgi:hypothetical protein
MNTAAGPSQGKYHRECQLLVSFSSPRPAAPQGVPQRERQSSARDRKKKREREGSDRNRERERESDKEAR